MEGGGREGGREGASVGERKGDYQNNTWKRDGSLNNEGSLQPTRPTVT